MDILKGKKTYIVAAALFVLGGLRAIGVISDDVFQSLAAILAGLGAASLRSAVQR